MCITISTGLCVWLCALHFFRLTEEPFNVGETVSGLLA